MQGFPLAGLGQNSGVLISRTVVSGGGLPSFILDVPPSFEHLLIKCHLRDDRSAATDDGQIQFNNDTGSNYTAVLYDNSSTTSIGVFNAGGSNLDVLKVAGATGTAGEYGDGDVWIDHYSRDDCFKTVRAFSLVNNTIAVPTMRLAAGKWLSKAPITMIRIFPQNGTPAWIAGSIVDMLGIGYR